MSDAQYSVEVAKSGKSKCKRCKTSIEKGTLRLATTVENELAGYMATSYMHPACFNLPRKYSTGANKMSAEDFVRQVLRDGSDSGRDILPAKNAELAAAIATTATPKKKTGGGNDDNDGDGDGTSPKAWIASIKAAFEKLEDEPASKKAKKQARDAADTSSKREVITQAHIDAYASYKACKADELKDMLRWNNQILVGTKDVILCKVIDGIVFGRLGRCSMCNGGKLKFNVDNAHEILCNGVFDEATQRKIACPYTTMPSKAPRFLPWYTAEPSQAEKEAMENEIEQAKGGGFGSGGNTLGTSDDPNVNVIVAAVKAQVGDNHADAWNLKSTKGMRSASIMVAKILLDHHSANSGSSLDSGSFKTIDLPRDDADKDYKNAKLKVAEVVQMNREKSIDEMIPLLIGTFGYVEDKKKKASVKQDKLAETVAVPANAPIIAALQELAELYFKEGNRNAGSSYVKAVKALSELDYVITKDNALQLGKGKTKVAGIGKGTAEKIFEFFTTGEIAKLQEKRGDAA